MPVIGMRIFKDVAYTVFDKERKLKLFTQTDGRTLIITQYKGEKNVARAILSTNTVELQSFS